MTTYRVDDVSEMSEDSAPMEKLDVRGTYGTIYVVQQPTSPRVYKYHRFETQWDRDVWRRERQNCQFINRNLEHRPDLPYPYTHQTTTDTNTGVIVQQYIQSNGPMSEYADLDVFIEAVATLAEAHQGDTVRHHFMHLDAHDGNFLVASSTGQRVVDLGGFKYTFGTHGFQLYLIDFGLSHFVDDAPAPAYNTDLDGVIMSSLRPAYDFITLYRTSMHRIIENVIGTYVYDGRQLDEPMYRRLTVAVQIGTAMIARHIKSLADRCVKSSVVGPVDDLGQVVNLIYATDDEQLQSVLVQLVDRLFADVRELKTSDDATTLKRAKSLASVAELLTGTLYWSDGQPHLDRHITVDQLDVLNDECRRRLSIRPPPPSLTGLALYLWYLSETGVL